MNVQKATVNSKRTSKGSSLLELPCTLLVFFIMLLMPMLNLATTTLRCSLMSTAVQEGAHAASKAKTYQNGSSDKPAATVVAPDVVKLVASKFSGLIVDDVETSIVITDSVNGSVNRQATKLTTPADTTRFIYQIETNVKAHVEPLMKFDSTLFGTVPGLTSAIPMSYSSRELFENPNGLSQ